MSEETPFVNVLLLGELSFTKSLFIDLFANYLKHENLSCAMKKVTPNSCVLDKFKDVEDYIFDVKNVKLRLIDTPNLSYGTNRLKNLDIMKNIICKIAKYGHINAIAIVIKSRMELIEDIIEYLLPHFDKSMCKNIIFIYKASSKSMQLDAIKQFLENIPEDISCFKQNTFIISGLFFKYLEYIQNNIYNRQVYKVEDWKKARICCKNFIDYIFGDEKSTGLMPHFIKPIIDDFNELFRFLADSACALSENSKILQKQHGSYNKFYFKKSSLISLVNATKAGKSVYICKSARCKELEKKVNVLQKFCERASRTQLDCSCGCPMNMHHSAKYLRKLPHQTNGSTINRRNAITFASIQEELNQVLDSLVTVSIYKIQTYKLTEDPFVSYLDNYTYVDHNNLKKLYYDRKQGKETTTITLQDVSKCMEQLKTLNWMGSTIKNIYGNGFNIETEIAIEKQLKTIEKSAAQLQSTTQKLLHNNVSLPNEMKLLKQQNNELLEQVVAELNSIRADTAKNQELINKIENNKQENISKQASLTNEYTRTVEILEKAFNKHVVQAENQQILNNQVKQQVDNLQDATKKLKKELSDITQAGIHPINQSVNNLHVDIKKLKESIQLTNNSNVSHQALINQRIDNLCHDMKIVKQLSNITPIEDRQLINNLRDDITNIKEFMQALSNEMKEMKQLITNVIVEQQSISDFQAVTLQCNQEANDEQPKKFQKLIEDINNLKKIKEMQECDDEINVEGQEDNAEGEKLQSAQPKFQKLIENSSNLKKLKEHKNPNENNEMMEEVKRITGQQISKQFEDLKIFIKDTLANKQNGEDTEVDNKQEKP